MADFIRGARAANPHANPDSTGQVLIGRLVGPPGLLARSGRSAASLATRGGGAYGRLLVGLQQGALLQDPDDRALGEDDEGHDDAVGYVVQHRVDERQRHVDCDGLARGQHNSAHRPGRGWQIGLFGF